MSYSIATKFSCIDPPSGFTLHPEGCIAYGPWSGNVYSIWTPERGVEVMVREEAAGGHNFAAARDLRDYLDAVVVAFGILGSDGVTALSLQRLIGTPTPSALRPR